MGSEEQRQVYKKEWYLYAERSQRINPNSILISDSNFPWAHTEHQQYFQAHLQYFSRSVFVSFYYLQPQ